MNPKQKLIIVTQLLPQGETGVQTHFNAILAEADKRGIPTQLIHPYHPSVFLARKAIGVISKVLRKLNRGWFFLWSRWGHYFLIRFQLRRELRNSALTSVIYAQDPFSARAALAARNGQPVIMVVHFNVSEADEALTRGLSDEHGLIYQHFQQNEAYVLPLLDKLIFVSSFMQTLVNERLPAINSLPQQVIANFIREKPSATHTSALTGQLISIGTLEKRKNQSFLLKVLAKAHALGHFYHLTLIGDGPDRLLLEKLANSLHISEYVNFLGFQANAEIFMKNHLVYVHAALMENLPITLLEALSHGLPILAPATGGIPEILDNGIQGYFWPLDDEDIAAHRLCDLMENETLRVQLSHQAQEKFTTHFSERALADVWLNAVMNS